MICKATLILDVFEMSIWRRNLWICFKLVYLSIFLTFIYNPCSAQESSFHISGLVVDAGSKIPVSVANVYLEQTTVGTVTTDNGTFALNVPNSTDRLIVSHIGYKPSLYKIEQGKISKLLIDLESETKLLNEVEIKINPRWQADFSLFQIVSLENNFRHCEILNTEALSFSYTNVLIAKASNPLIIENRFLGYRLYYDLSPFVYYPGRISYAGYTRFEELSPNDHNEEREWRTNRKQAYQVRQLILCSHLNKRLKRDGYLIKKLVKTQIPPKTFTFLDKWPDNEVNSNDTILVMTRKSNGFTADTIMSDNKIIGLKPKIEYNVLYPNQTMSKNIVTPTASADFFKVSFDQPLFVSYKKTAAPELSIIIVLAPGFLVNIDGNLSDPNALLYKGYWGSLRVGNQLPINSFQQEIRKDK